MKLGPGKTPITCVKNVRLSKRLVFLYYNELLMNYVYWYYCVRFALQVLKFQKSNFALNTSDFSFCNSMEAASETVSGMQQSAEQRAH